MINMILACAFNTPSNIPRIETAGGKAAIGIGFLLTPPPTYQGLKLRGDVLEDFILKLLTPPPTYQGLKPLYWSLWALYSPLLTPPPTYQGLKQTSRPLKEQVSFKLLTPPPTYQGLKLWKLGIIVTTISLLTPPPTYQGLKHMITSSVLENWVAFNTPSNIPRIETDIPRRSCRLGLYCF